MNDSDFTRREVLWNRNFTSVCAANFLLFFSFYLLLPVLPLYLSDVFSADRSTIGIILSAYTLTALIIRPFGGFIVDTFPRKKVLLICYFAFFILFAGYMAATSLLIFAIVRCAHGFAFGSVTVSNSTVAIDVMPSSRRGEGIGYYGVANNLAMVIGPSLSLWMYDSGVDTDYIFGLALGSSGLGLLLDTTLRPKARDAVSGKQPLSLDRFFLVNAMPESLMVLLFSFAYAILSTYLAIYAKVEVGIKNGSGLYFVLLAIGLIAARLVSSRWVRKGLLMRNVGVGMLTALIGFVLFLWCRNSVGFYLSALVLGGGYGAMCPSFQTSFINMAPNSRRGTANSTYLTSWDVGAGAGIMAGGAVAQCASYHVAYIMALSVGCVGAIAFFAYIRSHYERNKMRM